MITDELREWGESRAMASTKETRRAIADHIDAEHEMATSEFWQKINAVPATDENMAERGWVRLPKDADGEYIHVGDVMECTEPLHPDVPKVFTVQRISLESDRWTLVAYPASYRPESCRHHKQPTVEDVLQEFAEKYAFYKEVGIHPDLKAHEEVLRQYAAKLRLAGEGE